MIGRGPPSDQLTFSFPKSMSNTSTVATAKDVPNHVLTTGLTDSVPAVPASGVAQTVPRNAVPTQPPLFGSIIGDKYAPIQNSDLQSNHSPVLTPNLLYSPYFQAGFGLMVSHNLPFGPHENLTPYVVGPRSRAHRSTSSLNLWLDRFTPPDARLARDKQQRQSVRLVPCLDGSPNPNRSFSPIHPRPLSPLGTESPAERGDHFRATQEREFVCDVQPCRWPRNPLV